MEKTNLNDNKELLLKGLCARLPYGVKVCIKLPNHQEKIFEEHIGDLKEITRYGEYLVNSKGIDYRSFDLDIKPYLRPMSSMTEEEGKEYRMFIDCSYNDFTSENTQCVYVDKINDYLDWLNAHHFDYRGLIEKNLALDCTDLNVY